jgi:hypothetical protein
MMKRRYTMGRKKIVPVSVPEEGVMLTVWLGSAEEYDELIEAIEEKEADGLIQDVQVTRLD